jgi:ABC-type antimicrobial peptide transport system permease subunit
MIRNYITIAFRNFLRNAGYSSINVFGFSIGIATAILIFMWVAAELKYNTSFKDHERIYQVLNNAANAAGETKTGQSTPGPLAEAMMSEFGEVEVAGRVDFGNNMLLRHENNSLVLRGLWADPQILKVFSIPVLQGKSDQLLIDPSSFLITQQTAEKFFPNQNPLGKEFKVDEKYTMTISAVVADPPANSSLSFDFLLPYDVYYKENQWMSEWGNYNDRTFFKLKQGADIARLDTKLRGLLRTKRNSSSNEAFAQSIADTHLYNRYEDGKPAGGRIEYVRLLSIAAVFILLIACINYMNLATARSANRGREVGVRKVSGAHRGELIFQFISESLMITTASVVLSLVIVQIVLPTFSQLMNQNLELNMLQPQFIASILGLTILTSLIAGSYPAFFLSSFRPAVVLKGLSSSRTAGGALRKGLVIFQFALSVSMIIFSLTVYEQTQFIKTKNLGFDRDNVIVFDMHNGVYKNQEAFKTEALKFPGVKSVTVAGQDPFSISANTRDVVWSGKNPDESIPFKLIFTDKDFIPTLKFELLEGRNFIDNKSDTTNYIINEAAARIIGYKNPLGEYLSVWNSPTGKIIGIIKDFHNVNLRNNIEPVILMCRTDNTWRAFAKLENNSISQAVQHLGEVQKKFDPAYPFNYEFLDKNFQKEYITENRTEKLSILFTVVAIMISCLGLFGLAAFTTEQRTKEIGIRKILGASIRQITVLLCNDFVKLVAISFVIATPLTWYLAANWLQSFAYHIELTVLTPIVAAGLLLMIVLISVGYQSLSAALGNPADSLKND